jgi:hypothetical protein
VKPNRPPQVSAHRKPSQPEPKTSMAKMLAGLKVEE